MRVITRYQVYQWSLLLVTGKMYYCDNYMQAHGHCRKFPLT